MEYAKICEGLEPSTRMLLDKVKRFLSAGKASVMVGCGFSKNAESNGTVQMREWNDLNLDLFKSLYSREPKSGELDKLSPIRLASQVESVHGAHELDEIIMNALPDKSVYPGTLHKKLMKLHWHDVFTTNYDTLLERSCDESGSAYTVVTTKETLLYSKSPRIVKLHGSFPDIRPFIMSEEHFRTYPQKYPEFVNTVRQSLIENLFCLIGFSGNDPNFLSWLGWLRDVMGDQMTNAILVDYKSDGIHISERQLFASRKIDIINLAEIKGISTYKEGLDFFLTYIGEKDKPSSWNYPDISPRLPWDKGSVNYQADIEKMTNARLTYPGWLFMPEREYRSCNISRFILLERYYSEMPDELKLRFLYELDWLLDIALYPKDMEWYISALGSVKDKFDTYRGEEREKAVQLVLSLMSYYRERRNIDGYFLVSEFIKSNIFEELSQRQQAVFFYEQCLWDLARLDYNRINETLLKWHISENEFQSALWQASIYAEIGNLQMAEDMLVSYYSRLTTQMLLENKSEYFASCAQLYSYVMPRTVRRHRTDVELPEDNTIEELKRKIVEDALKEQPKQTQEHGFNIGQVSTSTHSYQGGFVADYLNANRYMRLSYLHGSTYRIDGYDKLEEYGKVLAIIAKYHLYQAVDLSVRCGKESLLEKVASREILSQASKDNVYLIFTDLFELLKENEKNVEKRKSNIAYSILVPLLQRFCCKADDGQVMDLFGFVLAHSEDKRIKRNDILTTIYNSATSEQRKQMFTDMMNHPIVLDVKGRDLLWPDSKAEILVREDSLSELINGLNDKDVSRLAYSRIMALLECDLPESQREAIEKAIISWRKIERKDVNAFFSYNAINVCDDDDAESLQWWISQSLDKFLNEDYTFNKSSECFSRFTDNIDYVVPALTRLSNDDTEKVILKTLETLRGWMPQMEVDDRKELFGGLRHFTSDIFRELVRVFSSIKFDDVSDGLKNDLSSLLSDCYALHHPCLSLLSCMCDDKDCIAVARSAHSRLLSSSKEERTDAMRAIYHILKFKKLVEEEQKEISKYFSSLNFFFKYSHNKNIGEYLSFLAVAHSDKLMTLGDCYGLCDALLTIHNEIDDYEMSIEYKTDIAYYANELAGVLHQLGVEHSGIRVWEEEAHNPEQFRDIRNGWSIGVEMMSSTNAGL